MTCRIIGSKEEYEQLKNGELDWNTDVEELDEVLLPYSVFNRLMLLDKAVEEACKEEEENDV